MMILQTLGTIRLVRSDGTELDELLRQPKRLALLSYLCSPRPGVWHRRDVLLAAFWPGLDTPHARTALRNALYVLRQHLEERVIRTRGDEEVSIDPTLLETDVSLLEADIAAGRFADALARYGGDALPGLHVADSEGFEAWIDEERLRTRSLARSAAIGLADACERSGDPTGAADALARVVKLDPVDESLVRRLVGLLDRAGDRARALDAYERFRAQLAEEFDAEPASETVKLADEIRARRAVRPPASRSEAHGPALLADGPVAGGAGVDQRAPAAAPSATHAVAPATPPAAPQRPWPRRAVLSASILLVAAAGILGLTRGRDVTRRLAALGMSDPEPQTLVVLPMENATGHADVDYLATGIDEAIAKHLVGVGGLTAKSAARAEWTPEVRADLPRVGRVLSVRRAFRGTLSQVSDSFVITGDVIEIASGAATPIRREAFLVDQASDVASRVSASIVGALFSTSVSEMPRGKTDRVDAESFRLTLQGWHALLSNRNGGGNSVAEAQALFDAAIQRDPMNARAHAGLSSIWAARASSMEVPFEDGARLSEAEARKALVFDPQEGTAIVNLGAMLGYRLRSIVAADSFFVRAAAVDPGNPEIPMVRAALYRHAWRWDRAMDQVRIARELDPLSPWMVDREAIIGLCGDNAAEALRLYRMEVVMSPNDTLAMRNIARALARLGRWDEAAEQLRRVSPPALVRDTMPIDSLTGAKRVYWQLVHAEGKLRLARAIARAGPVGVPSVRLAWLRIAAGQMDAGLDELAKAAARGDFAIYRSPCQPDADEAKSSPRFQRILASLPKWE